jgi:hypothetical protein
MRSREDVEDATLLAVAITRRVCRDPTAGALAVPERKTLRRTEVLLLNEMAPTVTPQTAVRGFSCRGATGRIPEVSALSVRRTIAPVLATHLVGCRHLADWGVIVRRWPL